MFHTIQIKALITQTHSMEEDVKHLNTLNEYSWKNDFLHTMNVPCLERIIFFSTGNALAFLEVFGLSKYNHFFTPQK